jgi:acyl-CoA dehydrogenase family protein 9
LSLLRDLYVALPQDRSGPYGIPRLGEETQSRRLKSLLKSYERLVSAYEPRRLEQEGSIPEELWKGLKRLGIFGLSIPKRYGGLGLELEEYLQVVRVMAREDMALAIIPLAHLSIGCKGIQLFGSEEQKTRYLPRAASGELVFAYCLTEPHVGSDAQNVESLARLSEDGSHYLLDGSKTFITNANYAGAFTVFAQMDPEHPGSLGAFVVEKEWEGVSVGRDMHKMGLALSSTAPVTFRSVRVPAENLLGEPGEGFKIAMTILNYGRLGLGAASEGIMARSVSDMMARAAQRRQFGVPIASFELIREKIARAEACRRACQALTRLTARLLEAEPLANVAVESSHCKLFGTTRAWETVYDALQVAGGAGYLRAMPYEKRMRDFRVATLFEGTTEIHSVYPPLLLARSVQKTARHSRAAARIGLLLRGLFGRPRLSHPPYAAAAERRAARLAARAAGRFRRLLHLTLLLYGRKLSEKELMLERLTRLSLSAYILISLLATAPEEPAGREAPLLQWWSEEAWKSLRQGRLPLKRRRDGTVGRLFQVLEGAG